jgi:hypothetical protein
VPRPKPAAIELDPRRVATLRLERQHLRARSAANSLEIVATDLIGVQAQVVSSAALSLALRVKGARFDDAAAAQSERRLVRAWGMRATLHLWAADDYPLVVAALGRRETWRRPVWFRYFGISEAEMEQLIETIGEVLGDGRPRTRAALADEIGERLGPKQRANLGGSWGTYLKPAAMRGLLCQAAGEGNTVTFTRPDVWIGRWHEVDPDEALATLLRRYLHAYGPSTIAEIGRWWGDRASTFKPILESFGNEIVEVEFGGSRGLLLREDVEAVRATRPDATPVLLGPFDPLTVGLGRRDWFIPAAHLTRVSRTAGWISPVLMIGGIVAGVWTGERRGSRLRVTVDPFDEPSTPVRRGIERAAARVAAAHDAPLDFTFGPVYSTS